MGRIRGNSRDGTDDTGRTFEMVAAKGNLLFNVFRLEDFAEILHAHVAVRAIGSVVGPVFGIEAPPATLPFGEDAFGEGEAAHDDDFAADLTELGHAWVCVPVVDGFGIGAADVVIAEDLGELLVGGVACAFTLQGEDDGLGRIFFEKLTDLAEEAAELLGAREADGEDAMDEIQFVVFGIAGVLGLDANVEESHAVLKLLAGGDGLTAH